MYLKYMNLKYLCSNIRAILSEISRNISSARRSQMLDAK